MGFAITSTVVCGGAIAAGFAISDDMGMAAAGLFGTLYACGMGFYGVAGLMGAVFGGMYDEAGEKPKRRKLGQAEGPTVTGALQSVVSSADSSMERMQENARPRIP